MRKTILALIACAAALPLFASTVKEEQFTCPLDGTAFESYVAMSGTSFGMQLDLMRLGSITQPWPMAQCPTCLLPLFQDTFTDEEKGALKETVRSERFKKEVQKDEPYYALGIIREARKEPPFAIGWAYLLASWEARDAENYTLAATRAIAAFDKAIPELEKDKERKNDLDIARYLPIEHYRRMGDFENAAKRLEAFRAVKNEEITWFPLAITLQTDLIAKKDSSPAKLEEPEKKRQKNSAPGAY